MTSQERLAADFRALHLAPPILVLANVWDVASAVAVRLRYCYKSPPVAGVTPG